MHIYANNKTSHRAAATNPHHNCFTDSPMNLYLPCEKKKKKRPANLPTSLLEQPPGSPPLSELTSDHLALVVDGPSLVRETTRDEWVGCSGE